MAKNRYTETTHKRSPMGPLPTTRNTHTTVKDNRTGEKGTGWGNTERESRGNAWKDLRGKQGG